MPTSPDRYALGRNSIVSLTFRSKVLSNGSYVYSNSYNTTFQICISEGSVSLDTDNIDIPSNCQSGWRLKLPGLKSGTVSGTGYVAVSGTLSGLNSSGQYNLYKYLGDACIVSVQGYHPELNEFPFNLQPGTSGVANGYFKTGSVTINPDDAVKVSFSVELSGAQDVAGFVATA